MSGDDRQTTYDLPDIEKVIRVLRLIARGAWSLRYILPALVPICFFAEFVSKTTILGIPRDMLGLMLSLLPVAVLQALSVLIWLGFVWFFASYFAAALENRTQPGENEKPN